MFSFLRARRGTIAFDMAIMTPIFLVLAVGIIEYGRGLMVCNLIDDAAREGTLTALQSGATNTEVRSAVQEFLKSAMGLEATDVSVSINIVPGPANLDPQHQIADSHPGDRISVKVRVPPSKIALLPGEFWRTQKYVGESTVRVD